MRSSGGDEDTTRTVLELPRRGWKRRPPDRTRPHSGRTDLNTYEAPRPCPWTPLSVSAYTREGERGCGGKGVQQWTPSRVACLLRRPNIFIPKGTPRRSEWVTPLSLPVPEVGSNTLPSFSKGDWSKVLSWSLRPPRPRPLTQTDQIRDTPSTPNLVTPLDNHSFQHPS